MNKIKLFLTKLIYKNPHGIYKDVKKLKLYNGTDIEIILVSDRNAPDGLTTIFNTIIIKESVFGYNNDEINYILTHEYAHTKQNLLFIIEIFSSIMLLAYLIRSFQQHPFYFPYGSLIVVGFFSIFSWILEIDADCYTIKDIGKENFLNLRYDRKRKAPQMNFFEKLNERLKNPPSWVTIKIYDFMNNKSKN